jgi:hypothetical protein
LLGFPGGREKTFLVACLPPAGKFVTVCSGHFGLAIGDRRRHMQLRKVFLTVAMGGMMLVSTAIGADDKVTSNPEMYSDRDRSKALKSEEEKLEQVLKTGEEKGFYRRELEKNGLADHLR